MEPVKRRPVTPATPSEEDDAYTMYICKKCGQVVSALEHTLPCPSCGNYSYRKISSDSPEITVQRSC